MTDLAPQGATAGHSGAADGGLGRPACGGRTRMGEPCKAFAPPGRALCPVHDPERAEAVRAARSRGATSTNKLRALRGRLPKLDDTSGLVRFTARLIGEVYSGQVTADTARVLVYAMGLQRQLLETSDLEVRLRAVEDRIHMEKGQRRWG